jgi:glycerophosphoryl diester phosphodiesterase
MRLGCIALDLKHTLLTRERVDEIHTAGLRVATWTVNDPARAQQLIAWGADTVITDAVDVIAPR